jgi:hypothetical protein
MPAKDIFHDAVKSGLEKEGWTITADPLWLQVENSEAYVDLAAEKMIAARKGEEKIAVEIKSFVGRSRSGDFHNALGQFLNYRLLLTEVEPDRMLYLAVPLDVYQSFFGQWLPRKAIAQYDLKIIVYDPAKEVLVKWLT